MINRRLFLAGMLTSGAVAPAVVSARSIMPISVPRISVPRISVPRMWVPKPWVLLPDFDYSTCELRVAALLAADEAPSLTNALAAFQNRGLQFQVASDRPW
jgi:hypothetical protein